MRGWIAAVGALAATACGREPPPAEETIRGLRAFQVKEAASSEVRRYPSIVRPATETQISFEVGGRLQEVALEVGQTVAAGEILARIDPRSLELQVEQSRAALAEAEASAANARAEFDRNRQLLERDLIAPSAMDRLRSNLETADARAEQARRSLSLAEENLSKAVLPAPFDGVIASVDADSFVQVSAGQAIASIYSETAFEIGFSVPASVVGRLSVGDRADVVMSDLSRSPLAGVVTEIGARAPQVSSFPVVVTLSETPSQVRAGMAAEVALDVALEASGGEGYLVPISAFALTGPADATVAPPQTGLVYVFDADTETVSSRVVRFSGIRENMAIVYEGLAPGDVIASAGVSYLRDGQRVRLLPLAD